MKPFFIFLFTISLCSKAVGQDSTKFFDRFKLSWESYNAYAPNKEFKSLLPKSIGIRRGGNYAYDNPLNHGGSTFGLRLENEIIKNYRIDVRFMAEHRGISYGVFKTNDMIVYPILRVSFVDTIRLKSQKWIISGSAGQERDLQQGEGLYLYNLNCHAERLRLQVRPNLIFEMFHIGDLLQGIGLQLDELFQESVILKNLPLSKNSKKRLDLQLSLTQWWAVVDYNYYIKFTNSEKKFLLPEISTSLTLNPVTKIYAHIGYKKVKRPYQIDSAIYYTPKMIDKFAAVIGAKRHKKQSRWDIETVVEARFYGKTFNYERASRNVFYAPDPRFSFGRNASYTIGTNLYPLLSYDRPFSQWGVFTEYQNKNVGAITLRAKGNRQLKGRLHWYFDADYNAIFAENEKPFHYFFCSTGLNYKFRSDIDCVIGMTNKGMNLDVFYPTLYFFPKPSILVFLKKAL